MSNIFDLKLFLKYLGRNKTFTYINITGFAISLMFVIYIGTYLYQELHTDHFHENASRIYLMGNESSLVSAYRLNSYIDERFDEIEMVCPVTQTFENMPISFSGQLNNGKVLFADTTFFDMFSFHLLQGNRREVLSKRENAVVSRSFAEKEFAGKDPIGQEILIGDSLYVMITGVMDDIRHSMIMNPDILVRIDNIGYFYPVIDNPDLSAEAVAMFVLVKDGVDMKQLEEDMRGFFQEFYVLYMHNYASKVSLIPLKKLYFKENHNYSWLLKQAEIPFLYILYLVGLVLVLFAGINYINLSVAQSSYRAKEMAIRQFLSASRAEIIMRLVLESVLISFISFLLAIALAFLFLPEANYLVGENIDLIGAITPLNVSICFGLVLFFGVDSGWLPAVVISKTNIHDVLTGNFRRKTKMIYNKILIILQLTISMILVGLCISMLWQINHMIQAPLGYDMKNIIEVEVEEVSNSKVEEFAERLKEKDYVKNISLSFGTPFNKGVRMSIAADDVENITAYAFWGDENFIDILGLEIKQQNPLLSDTIIYVNEEMIRVTQIPVDGSVRLWGQLYLAGVVNDFQFGNITEEKLPAIIQIKTPEEFPYGIATVLIETTGEDETILNDIRAFYEEMIGLDFTGQYHRELLKDSFALQHRILRILLTFTILAVFISSLGILAIASYYIQTRSKEIAVRKIFGSTNPLILIRLIKSYLLYVLIAFVFSVPAIWVIMDKWILAYEYRISMNPLIFIAAGLLIGIVSLGAVYWQCRLASEANPVESLRNE